ncbi:MAG: hydantoinase B/oxoprolinase family protein [Sulfolobales archaeon]|nr:hydantoinase B/oxoprolinase family protein [Sulfolobales archaeon]
MGVALKRSAFSPNIRERMDHSCAVLDAKGRIVAQAEHIPVHLGSFRVGAQNALRWLGERGVELEPGDMVALNDPYIAGTHLNDVMLLAPVYVKGNLIGYVVNKAHHVDVGGPVPGSINPSARSVYEEGFLLPPVKVVRRGKVEEDLARVFAENSKTPSTAVGDLHAQIAANVVGARRVEELAQRFGLEALLSGWERAIEYGRLMTLSELRELEGKEASAEDYLELPSGDVRIAARVRVEGGVMVDFAGTSPQLPYPINAVFGVTFAATAFAVRTLMEEDVPTNEGFYSVLEVRAPEGSLLNPRKPAPVSGGNVETSQRVADVVLRALAEIAPERVPAAGSGTMMNVMLGGEWERGYWAYYETVGGGTGGRPGKRGVSGVHVNMTNTLNTPIEMAERSYPLLFTAYKLREGSGGRGKFPGGDGIVRAFRLLRPARLSLMAERFRRGPYGLWGGEPGREGRATIRRRSGEAQLMPSKFSIELEAGDEVILETPGGGGWGGMGEQG